VFRDNECSVGCKRPVRAARQGFRIDRVHMAGPGIVGIIFKR